MSARPNRYTNPDGSFRHEEAIADLFAEITGARLDFKEVKKQVDALVRDVDLHDGLKVKVAALEKRVDELEAWKAEVDKADNVSIRGETRRLIDEAIKKGGLLLLGALAAWIVMQGQCQQSPAPVVKPPVVKPQSP